MANEENLISLGDRTTDEQRAIQSAGGIASGKARRERKKMREQAEILLSLPLQNALKNPLTDKTLLAEIKAITGIEDDEQIDNQFAMIAVRLMDALNKTSSSSVQSFNSLRELVGEKKTDIDLNGGVNINFGGENDIAD